MKLSVIVPVYQVEATLDRCVASIVGQTFSDLEVILVDDGSSDRSPQLCDEWAAKDSRVRVIHKTNGGLSDARNAGLDVATGDFVTFVDSDDYLEFDTYQQVLPISTSCDIVEFPVFRFYGSNRQSLLTFASGICTDVSEYWLKHYAYQHTYAWNKIYKATLFANVRFPKDRVFEDVYTLPLLLQRANQVGTTSKGLYYYCQNDQGITSTAKGPELTQLLDAHLDIIRQWCDDAYYMHVLNIQMDVYEQTGAVPRLPSRRINPFSANLSSILRMKAIMLNILGIKRICILNKIIHRWRTVR